MDERLREFYERYDIWIMMGVILLVFGIMSVLQPSSENSMSNNRTINNKSGCALEYSDSMCKEGEILTIFHNPSDVPVKEVEIIIPDGQGGENIYKPGSPLPVNETSYLNTGECSSQEMESMKLSYCCGGNCTVVPMDDPSDDLSIEEVKDD